MSPPPMSPPPMSKNAHLAGWSRVLFVLAAAAALFALARLLSFLFQDGRVTLLKEGEVRDIFVADLSALDRTFVSAVMAAQTPVWLYALSNMAGLARAFRRGMVFERGNARRVMRIGFALTTIGVLQSTLKPVLAVFLYWRGVIPWLADLPLAYVIHVDTVMAGLFFVILGKVMHRAIELDENQRLIV
jgi:hypothetical protein